MSIIYSPITRNDGSVKINDGNGIRPRWDSTTASLAGVWRRVDYLHPLGYGYNDTRWPSTLPSPADVDIFNPTDNTFIENYQIGQVHHWRINLAFAKSAVTTQLTVRFYNTFTGYDQYFVIAFTPESVSGFAVANFTTVAQTGSLPAPYGIGKGHRLFVRSSNASFQSDPSYFLEVEAVTRISQHYDPVR